MSTRAIAGLANLGLTDRASALEIERLRMQREAAQLDREQRRMLEKEARLAAVNQVFGNILQAGLGTLNSLQQNADRRADYKLRADTLAENVRLNNERINVDRQQAETQAKATEARLQQEARERAISSLQSRMPALYEQLNNGEVMPAEQPAAAAMQRRASIEDLLIDSGEQLPRVVTEASKKLDAKADQLIGAVGIADAKPSIQKMVDASAEQLAKQYPELTKDEIRDMLIADSIARKQSAAAMKAKTNKEMAESEATILEKQASANRNNAVASHLKHLINTGGNAKGDDIKLQHLKMDQDALEAEIKSLDSQYNTLIRASTEVLDETIRNDYKAAAEAVKQQLDYVRDMLIMPIKIEANIKNPDKPKDVHTLAAEAAALDKPKTFDEARNKLKGMGFSDKEIDEMMKAKMGGNK